MRDLIESVHFAVSNVACIHTGEAVNGKCPECAKITRAAIRAVLAHFAEAGNVTERMCFAAIQSKFTREIGFAEWKAKAVLNYQDPVAAAMAAALKEMGPKP